MWVKGKNGVVKAERKRTGGNALAGWILALKTRIRKARLRAVLSANAELIRLYLDIGCEILDRAEKADWGSKVLETVSSELRREFPGMHGFSVRNLKYMRVFAREWRGNAIGQRLVAQLPWGHNIVLLESVPSIGIVLCKSRDALVVEYALADMKRPAGVATYQLGLPSAEVLQERLTAELR